METQEQSQLFRLPLEVRYAIYGYLVPNAIHVFVRQGKLALSPCGEPEVSGDMRHLGYERKPVEDQSISCARSREDIWVRRLQSSWGPHWQCEEEAQGTAHEATRDETTTTLLLVCRRMHIDIAQVLVSDVVFQVTDLETLEHLAQGTTGSEPVSSPYAALSHAMPSLRKLHITLRLSLPFFRALSIVATTSSSSDSINTPQALITPMHTSVTECDAVTSWLQVWPFLALRLQGLQSLNLWLDHDESASWSLVNERAILSSIVASMLPQSIARLGVTVNLPMLHPRYENPERHYTKGSPPPPAFVVMNRRLRQDRFYEETGSGVGSVTYEPDFPALLDLIDFTADPDSGPLMTYEDVEELERESWSRGVNPENIIWEMASGLGPWPKTRPPFLPWRR
ncbi:hypothetical protein CONLIGDRAFT_683309 [Coniochaeta ligniaria NRRL 30616]|uniref:DUF7730 domain-containing protein n=1 Tax=Coniochaeta ligniaria NRRL 30616 TaxID=1408157 RepID=A0A1J7J944_9PEZI|nr:hypothetical protein CONLIGDRAFT_683309 [Coniochaeta ligniaria NRRL 30616]